MAAQYLLFRLLLICKPLPWLIPANDSCTYVDMCE